ncbi:hypothetical protein LTR85_005588 [Meristemomyces frigidus]|nr:hypothetical protein LTR85_005588 [Meristemomyces frigidus]
MTTVQHAAPAATSKPSESQRAHFYAEAAGAGSMASHTELLKSLPASLWATRALVALQTFALPLAFYFKPVCVCVATFWLIYRAYQVVNKPLEELASLLGFDIPLTPVIDLANIKADGAILHWSLPEKPKNRTKLKFEIQLNGRVVDTVPMQESAVTLVALQPSSFYVVRVALMNDAEFGSKSEPIRFRTKPASSGDFFRAGADGHETDHDGSAETLPHVWLYRGLKDIVPAAIEAAPMTRETSSGGLGPKRSVTGRRPSPAVLGLDNKHDFQTEEGEPPEGTETVQQLTEKLDAIRRETDEVERQAKEEEEEELRMKDELTQERDGLRAEATEKEKASRNLKREVNTLERQNTAAQNERAKHERMLQQKKQERQKLKDDTARWEREAEAMKADVERIRKDMSTHLQRFEQEKEELQSRHAQESAATRSLDDEIREKNAEIKRLERTIKNRSPDGNETEMSIVHQFQQDAEEERNWGLHRASLQQQYTVSVQKLEAAKRVHSEQARYLESVRAQRRRDEEMAQQFNSPVAAQEQRLPHRGDSQRSRRGKSGNSTSDSPRMGGFSLSQSPFGNALTSVAPGFSAPFLNIHNGMTIIGPTNELSMSDEDRERLTGGAPMSPGAGAELLPADLFSNEGDNRHSPERIVQPLPGLGSLPGLPGLPGPTSLPAQAYEHPGPGPASPASASSRSPSFLASPQASQNNLHLGSPEHLMDSDRRSIISNRSNRATSGSVATGSRFSSMFGIKPRTKTMSADEGPALGKAQSHSMPRQDQGIPGLDSATRKRNSSISGTVFGADLPTHDGASDAPTESPVASSSTASRRKAFGMPSIFSRDKHESSGGGWPSSFTNSFGRRPGSPRPGSTHSNELPRPSMDSSRWGVDTWPSGDATAGARSSPLSFGPGWTTPAPQQPRLYGSRHPSRRPSVQYGASGPPEDIMEDSDSDALDPDSEPQLAPIGTKPSKKAQEKQPDMEEDQQANSGATPKLNPAAKDFKSFFGIKSKEKPSALGSSSHATPTSLRDFADDESPPNSRKSRDARSMTTTESSIAGESARTSNDLARTPSYSNSDATGPSPMIGSLGKESFMQKITRKSSSGKFGLPNFKREKSRLDPSSASGSYGNSASSYYGNGGGSGSYLAEDDQEEPLSASVGSLKEGRESKETNRGSGRSWSSVLKLGKGGGKKGGETPSLSGLSMASGTEEGTEDGEEE